MSRMSNLLKKKNAQKQNDKKKEKVLGMQTTNWADRSEC